MIGDQLSDVLDLIEIHGAISGGFAVQGPWISRTAVDDAVKLVAMVSGQARLITDGINHPIELEAGDVAVLTNASAMELSGGGCAGPPREITPIESDLFARLVGADRGTDDVVLCGRVDLNAAGQALLLQALPAVAHVRASQGTATNLRASMDRIFEEVTADRLGSAFAIRQYGQLLVLDMLRAFIDQAELPAGCLRLLTDDRLRPALRLMHAAPGKPWRLEELARAAAMSRTSFTERFRTMAGMPPLTYLNRWRMLLAQRALRSPDSDVRIGPLAFELGYASESAFSTAFKREVGESPLRYRSRVRTELAVASR